jgi:hypothetical protein
LKNRLAVEKRRDDMSALKAPTTIAYKLVLAISILFFLLSFLSNVGRPGRGALGMLYWGFAIWYMYKRDVSALVSLHRAAFWILATIWGLVGVYLLFADASLEDSLGFTNLGLVVVALLSTGFVYGLYQYFDSYRKVSVATVAQSVELHSIPDRCWERASIEFDSNRHVATWNKSFAMCDGDEAKAKAFYLKARAAEFALSASEPATTTEEGLRTETVAAQQSSDRCDASMGVPVSQESVNPSEDELLPQKKYKIDGFAISIFVAVGLLVALLLVGIMNGRKSSEQAVRASSPKIPPEERNVLGISSDIPYESARARLRAAMKTGEVADRNASIIELVDPKRLWDILSVHKISQEMEGSLRTAEVEKNGIWWIEPPNDFVVRLYNPSPDRTIVGVLYNLWNASCDVSGSRLPDKTIVIGLQGEPLLPNRYAVYSAPLPFDWRENFGSGIRCGIVSTVLLEQEETGWSVMNRSEEFTIKQQPKFDLQQ